MSQNRFVRSPALWTLYALLGIYAFLQNAIGPAVPALRAEFHLDHVMAALHISAFAVGMMISGFLAPTIMRRLGVHAALWGGQVGTFVGLSILVLAPNPWVSLAGILVAAVTGTVSLAAVQASVADQAGPFRGQALVEANMAASITSAAAPFVLLLGTFTGTGWRTLWPAFVVAFGAALVFGFRPVAKAVPDRPAVEASARGRLPRTYLRAWLLILVGVSVEWCVGFWAADYLKGLPGGVSLALAGAGTFQVAAVFGRLFSSRLTSRFGEKKILLGAVILTAVGFPLYWSLANPVVAFVGLALCGLGVCTFYPLGLSLAIEAAGPQAAKASSFATLASGSAILAAPLALGAIADLWSLQVALFAIPVGLVLMVGLLVLR
ncbi:MAG TPA: MFS transporter, partial [Spirochaetia bacterium]|nr:MFS transporter [Spirochaetia bacterium]